MPAAADIILEPFELVSCGKCGQACDVRACAPFDLYRCPACGAEWLVPARFANFIVLEQLGKGGMGAVYRAYDETLGRTVALKVTQQTLGQDRAFVQQFLQEARALAAINHPNIVQIYSYGEENAQPYIVMELVDGDRLDHMHAKHKALDETFVLETAIQVCKGMQASVAAGMTHGDIKPANILFDSKGNAKVSDFGLARLKGERPKPGEIWGTPYYVAPEVVRGQPPTPASDIYSLGGTLYHVLVGVPPFDGETVNDTVLLRFKQPAPDPRAKKPSISAPTAAILLRMLEADPTRRYPNYESLLIDLQRALAKLKGDRSGLPPPQVQEATRRTSILVFGAIALAILALLGFVVFKAIQRSERKAAKQAEFEKDKREGRLVQRIVGGKIQWVPAPPPASHGTPSAPTAAAPAPRPTSATLLPSLDFEVFGDGQHSGARYKPSMLLCAGTGPLDRASMIYLQFALDEVDCDRVSNASLRLTFGDKTTNKKAAPHYKATLWVLNDDIAIPDTVTWSDAPANDPTTPSRLDPARATVVAERALPANPRTGDAFEFDTLPKLAEFLRSYKGKRLTLAITADAETEHDRGWRFAASEDAERLKPPALTLSYAP